MFQLPIKLIELDFAKIEFFKNFLITTYIEGIVLGEAEVATVQDLSAEFYGEQPFGYISNRVNDYSRNLMANSYNRQRPNLFAFAIVYKSETALQIANFEKFFIKAPFKTFKTLNEAKVWMLEQRELI